MVSERALKSPLSVARIVNNLGISSRTLKRRPWQKRVTSRGVVVESWWEIPRMLLRKTDLSVQDFAALLGYGKPNGLAPVGRSRRAYPKARVHRG